MNSERLKQFYQEQLVKVGVEPQKAEQAAGSLTKDELGLIGEVWLGFTSTFSFYQIEREILALAEHSQTAINDQ
ncbi:MAG: hypothetical protein ACFB4I_22325 [Cyanophyceae cyanobacterium]